MTSIRDTDADNCGCGNCAASDEMLAAPNNVCAPYDITVSDWDNYRFYRNFCRYHGLKFNQFTAWLELDYREYLK